MGSGCPVTDQPIRIELTLPTLAVSAGADRGLGGAIERYTRRAALPTVQAAAEI